MNTNSIEIESDLDSESPRTSFDNCCNMLSAHSKYKLNDENSKEILLSEIRASKLYSEEIDQDYDLSSISVLLNIALKFDIIAAYKNLYIYDHSGISIATNEFPCPWDSGQYGFAYISKERAEKEFKSNTKEELESLIDLEVSTFNSFLTNDIFSFSILDSEGDIIDSCGGFYGSDPFTNGMKEQIDKKYHHLLNSI